MCTRVCSQAQSKPVNTAEMCPDTRDAQGKVFSFQYLVGVEHLGGNTCASMTKTLTIIRHFHQNVKLHKAIAVLCMVPQSTQNDKGLQKSPTLTRKSICHFLLWVEYRDTDKHFK